MSFSYDFAASPQIAQVRLLLADTTEFLADGTTRVYIFDDSEILGAYDIQRSLIRGYNLPISPLRVAALLIDGLASNQARLSNVVRLLDVTLAPSTVRDLRSQAQAFRDTDDECGFVMIESVYNEWSFRDRWFSQAMRRGAA